MPIIVFFSLKSIYFAKMHSFFTISINYTLFMIIIVERKSKLSLTDKFQKTYQPATNYTKQVSKVSAAKIVSKK